VTTSIGGRMAYVRGDVSQAQFAKRLGIHKNSLGNYERGERLPDAGVLCKLIDAGYNANWIISGHGPVNIDRTSFSNVALSPEMVREPPEDYSLVPLYDVSASAGHGALVESEQLIDYLAFKREWLRSELHATEGDLYLIEVDGESMEPTLRPGDIILIDRRNAGSIPRDGVYVLRLDGSLLVKRLQRMPGQAVRVTSDNAAYEPFSLSLDAHSDDLEIVGRVVWSGRRM